MTQSELREARRMEREMARAADLLRRQADQLIRQDAEIERLRAVLREHGVEADGELDAFEGSSRASGSGRRRRVVTEN